MGTPIDIPRAIAEDRKITYSHAASWKLYYDTAFGEQFAIPIWVASYLGGIQRIAKAADWQAAMQAHNNSLGGA